MIANRAVIIIPLLLIVNCLPATWQSSGHFTCTYTLQVPPDSLISSSICTVLEETEVWSG